MIRSIVTFISNWHKVRAFTAAQAVENRYPALLASKIRQHAEYERENTVFQQTMNAYKAQLDPIQLQKFNLKVEFNRTGSKLSQAEYQQRLQQLEQKQQNQQLSRKGLL